MIYSDRQVYDIIKHHRYHNNSVYACILRFLGFISTGETDIEKIRKEVTDYERRVVENEDTLYDLTCALNKREISRRFVHGNPSDPLYEEVQHLKEQDRILLDAVFKKKKTAKTISKNYKKYGYKIRPSEDQINDRVEMLSDYLSYSLLSDEDVLGE